MESGRPSKRTWPPFIICLAVAALLCLLCVSHTDAQFAKSSYYLDSTSDCYISGYLLIQTDGVVNIFSRKPTSAGSSELSCTVRFKPEDDRDIIDVSFTHMTISDKDVTLRVALTGAQSYTLSRGSPIPDKMQSTGGMVTVSLTRLNLEDRDYSFGVIVRVYKEDNTVLGDDEKPVGVGLVVGIVGGIIVFLVFIAVLVICCYRRRRDEGARGGDDHKVDLTAPSSPPHKFGLDNAATQNGTYLPPGGKEKEGESLSVKKKPVMTSQARPSRYRDQSDSESDSREEVVRKYNGSPVKAGVGVKYETERDDAYSDRPGLRRKREPAVSHKRDNLHGDRPGLRRNEEVRGSGRRQESSVAANQSLPPKSPILSALQNHPRFRASFHAAEQEAEEREQKIRGGGAEEEDAGNASDASMTMTWNTTFDTNFDDDPRPPAGLFIKPPSLPPVPMSPHEPVRRENVASIHRAPRLSSSSSEVEHLQAGEGPVSLNPEGRGHPPPSAGEIVPIRVQDPHSPSIRRKANAQRSLRPEVDERQLHSADSHSSESPRPTSRPKNSAPSKSKARQDDKSESNRKPKTKKPKAGPATAEQRDEVGHRPREVKRHNPREAGMEYEGRFKKSDSVRKSKSKSPRIGRSRSTGADLDDVEPYTMPRVTADDFEDSDVESAYRGRFKKSDSARKSKSRSPRIGRSRSTGGGLEDAESMGGSQAVPRVTADDYEDSDVESNYNPLRRTGSKNSLYTSRSSLYARRRRKNSVGESVYSFVTHDDLDYDPRVRDRDSFKEGSLSRQGERPFKSLGDLEMELQNQKMRSTQTLRECATQMGAGSANISPGKKMVRKKSNPRSVSSSQTAKSRSRNLDSSSSSSGVTQPWERKNSASSSVASARPKSRDRANSASSVSKGKGKLRNSDGREGRGAQLDQVEERRRPHRGQAKPKPKAKPRRGPAGGGLDDDLESIRTGMTGPLDQSSTLGGGTPLVPGQRVYPPQHYPGGYLAPPAPAGYPAHMAYVQATGQPPVMMPYPQGAIPPQRMGAVQANPAAVAVSVPTVSTAPPAANRPSKWDVLCQMTGAEPSRGGGGGDWNDSASVAGSVFSDPHSTAQPFPGRGGRSQPAGSDYTASERSGPGVRSLAVPSQGLDYYAGFEPSGGAGARSVAARSQAPSSRFAGRSAWDALKEMTDQESQYAPSESNV